MAATGSGGIAGREEGIGYWATVATRLKHERLAVASLFVLAVIVASAIGAPLLTPYSPYDTDIGLRLAPVGTPGHWLGTDEVGRDMWTRLVFGGRLTLLYGSVPVLCALVIGGGLGLLAGTLGGITNSVIMRTMDVFYAFPSVLLAIAITGILGTGVFNVLLALTAVFIPRLTRIAQSVALQVSTSGFIEASRANRQTTLRIVWLHVLPNALPPILVYTSGLVSLCIILASGLSFLGLGVAPPLSEWGLMLSSLRQAIFLQPLVAVLPGVLIFITSLSLNLLSDGIRNAMDIRQQA